MQTQTRETSTKSNFGSKGWLMIFFAGVMFTFSPALSQTD